MTRRQGIPDLMSWVWVAVLTYLALSTVLLLALFAGARGRRTEPTTGSGARRPSLPAGTLRGPQTR
jgi:hypothetical protein